MEWSWLDRNWCWAGLAISAVLLVLLFATNVFRSSTGSRWRDPVWLAWLAPASYMLHQFEEYGIDALGVRFAFPDTLCAAVGMAPYPACGLPHAVFVAINIPVVWMAGFACALLSRRFRFVGLGLYAIHFTNALSHLGVGLATRSYNPGMLTAGLILLPLSLWVAYACFGPDRLRRVGLLVLVGSGALASVILLAGVKLFAAGRLSAPALVTVEALNAVLVVVVPWLFNRAVARGLPSDAFDSAPDTRRGRA
jgi:hypothetical protein